MIKHNSKNNYDNKKGMEGVDHVSCFCGPYLVLERSKDTSKAPCSIFCT
jgi:hypothetical protein